MAATVADLPVSCPRSVAARHRIAGIVVLREQAEVGEPFDRAVEAYESLRIAPRTLLRMYRVVYFHVAAGRLAQARSASGDEREERLAQARRALKVLGRLRRDTDLRALERVARADLLVLQGEPRGALRLLAEADGDTGPDVPTAAFEAARVRARAMAALDRPAESLRQARSARAIAVEEGWPHRVAWVDAEFSVRDDDPAAVVTRLGGPTSTTSSRFPTAPTAGSPAGRATATQSGSAATVTGRPSRAVDAAVQLERQRLDALQQVSLAASRVVDPTALARICLDQTITILSAERALLFLTDDHDQLVPFLGRTAAGADVEELAGYASSLVEQVHAGGDPLVVTGTEEGAALGARSAVLHGLRSIVIAPLRLEERRLGVVYLDSRLAKGLFTAADVDILTALTTHIATALETARAAQLEISAQTATRERDLAQHLHEAARAIADAETPGNVLATFLAYAGRLTVSDAAWVVVRGPDGDRLYRPAGPAEGEPVDRDAALDALLGSAAPVVGSASARPAALCEQLDGSSWLSLPLHSRELGTGILLLRATRHPASPDRAGDGALIDRIDMANALIAQAVTAFDRATLFARVQTLAVIDELTGVANRRHFFDLARRDVDTSQRAGRPLTALMVDIDNFKTINDSYGHPTGDDVIRVIAQRLAAQIRSTDLLGRYGGEEFSLVVADSAAPLELGERLRIAVCAEPVPTRTGRIPVSVSVGLAQLTPTDDLETLLARADRALYEAKRGGRNRVANGDAARPLGSADGARVTH
jgi:diguanylate cyclase (GGDEF)-like protein